jgi:transcriptional regulator with XRE-family HTH domain
LYNVFRAEIERQKQLKGLTNADIAKAVGRAKNTVDIFMMDNPRNESKKLAEDIAAYLGIEITEGEKTE